MQIFSRFAMQNANIKPILKKSQQHIFSLLFYAVFTASFITLIFTDANAKSKDAALGLKTVCIDAGHGGKDPGCISRDGSKTREKNITLAVSKYLAEYIKSGYPDVKVVMTRSNDNFIELGERAAIANRKGADLFISIHVNSIDPRHNKRWSEVRGFSIHTLGQSRTGSDLFSFNMEVCKRENSVILLEDDYSAKYQGFNPSEPESYIFFNLLQNSNLSQSLKFAEHVNTMFSTTGPIKISRGLSQDPFYVLWKTTMPAVLIEVGFITNAEDLSVMKTEQGCKAIAASIYKAFINFKKDYDAALNIKASSDDYKNKAKQDDGGDILYGIQIMAGSRKLPVSDKIFKGYEPEIIFSGGVYKYIICLSKNPEEVSSLFLKVKKQFKGSFKVSISSNEVKRVI